MALWQEPAPIPVPPTLQHAVGGHWLVAHTLAQRGIVDPDRARAFLDPAHYTPASPYDLPGMAAAVQRIQQALQRGERIAVWGDFDVDGQTATTLLVQTLRALGGNVLFHIPVRASEGHGVHLPALGRLLDAGVQLVITCDTGIDAQAAVSFARARGVDFVITDHHDLPATLPEALAVVNPKRLPADHPLATLPGVGVAYKLAEALYPRASAWLDLVALGIVADVALQTGDTRYLLQRGLAQLRQTQRLGLQELLKLTRVIPDQLNEEHIGFELAPRLNALGRLDDANMAVELLTTDDSERARVLAVKLDGLNAARKRLTDQIFQGALAQLEQDRTLLNHAALVLAHPAWEPGVIGIVASRLVEHFHRPTVLLSTPPGQPARGSARSVEGCNITAAIAACSDLLISFGGHPMAAGLALEPAHIDLLRRRLAQAVAAQLGGSRAERVIQLDAVVPLAELSLDFVTDLERLAPFGPGNPRLTLASCDHALLRDRTIGRGREHSALLVEDENGASHEVLWWQGAGWPRPAGRFDMAYTARATTYRGQRQVQVEWVDARSRELVTTQPPTPPATVLDYRRDPDPLTALAALRMAPATQVWCEAEARRRLDGQDRGELAPAATLVIWTTPPSRAVLQAALAQVQPQQVVVFAVDPGLAEPEALLQRLAGLVKYALRTPGQPTSLIWLAAATAQTVAAVRLGLHWLAGRGHVQIVAEQGDFVTLQPGTGQASPLDHALDSALRATLMETAAFRRFFAEADPSVLLA